MTHSNPPEAQPTRAGRDRRSRRPVYPVTLMAIAGLIAAAWLGRGRFQPVVAGEPAPGFSATSLAGDVIALDQYRDKVVLLNVWATWCAPCREEMPSMERLYRDLSGEAFEILAVSVDDPEDGGVPAEQLGTFAAEFDLSFPILHSAPAAPDNVQQIYQTTGVPESFLIGRDGIIYRRVSGPATWDSPQYRDQIVRLLEE